MKYKIGVYGSAKNESSDIIELARAIGKSVAENNCILMTGSCHGIPHEAATSAKKHGGFIVGISPAANLHEHKEKYGFPTEFDLLVFTGSGKKGRNVVSVLSCDAAIFISGGSGTMNEFTIAYDEGKVCGVLTNSGGVADAIKEIEEKYFTGRKKSGVVVYNSDPEKLIEKVIEALG